MTTRIPPSLSWLIKRRARLQGDIAKAEKELEEICAVKKKRLEVLRADLNVIDATIRLHEIPIDPNCIKPIKGQTRGRVSAYGHLTSAVLAAVHLSHPVAISTTEVALFIGSELGITHDSDEFSPLRLSVGGRLKKMCEDGWVRRLHQARTNLEGRWTLGERALIQRNQIRQQ